MISTNKAPIAPPLPSELLDSTTTHGAILYEYLRSASGELEMAITVADRYSIADLTLLATTDNNSAANMRKILAGLVIESIVKYSRMDRKKEVPVQAIEARNRLKAIAQGVNVLGLQEVMDAGNIQSEVETPSIVESRNLTSLQAARYFGRRANRARYPFSDGCGW